LKAHRLQQAQELLWLGKFASERLGHSKIAITLDLYSL